VKRLTGDGQGKFSLIEKAESISMTKKSRGQKCLNSTKEKKSEEAFEKE